jgi:hypothetical protein
MSFFEVLDAIKLALPHVLETFNALINGIEHVSNSFRPFVVRSLRDLQDHQSH